MPRRFNDRAVHDDSTAGTKTAPAFPLREAEATSGLTGDENFREFADEAVELSPDDKVLMPLG